MEKNEEKKYVFTKRNFYTTNDAGKVYLLVLLITLFVSLIFALICTSVAKNMQIDAGDQNLLQYLFDHYLWFSIPMSILTPLCMALIFFAYNGIYGISNKSAKFSFKNVKISTLSISAGVGILGVFGFILLIEGVFGNMFHAFGVGGSSMNLPNNTIGWLFVNLFLSAVIPPICEELIFRGVVYNGLKRNFLVVPSVLISALLFALMHQNITQFVYPFVLGIVLAVVYEKTGNLIYSIIIHMFNNATTLVLDFLINKNIIHLNLIGMPWWMYILGIVIACAMCAIYVLLYKFHFSRYQKVEIADEGQELDIKVRSIGKMPLVVIFGGVLALFFIVLNLT